MKITNHTHKRDALRIQEGRRRYFFCCWGGGGGKGEGGRDFGRGKNNLEGSTKESNCKHIGHSLLLCDLKKNGIMSEPANHNPHHCTFCKNIDTVSSTKRSNMTYLPTSGLTIQEYNAGDIHVCKR